MPVYEFECERCGARFEELAADAAEAGVCPECGAKRARRLFSPVFGPGRLPRGAKVRDSDARRREREAQRSERLAETRKKRARGERG
jgi:putative FmdB family regulatory protein